MQRYLILSGLCSLKQNGAPVLNEAKNGSNETKEIWWADLHAKTVVKNEKNYQYNKLNEMINVKWKKWKKLIPVVLCGELTRLKSLIFISQSIFFFYRSSQSKYNSQYPTNPSL